MADAPPDLASPPVLAVIVPHYDDCVRLGRCLDVLAPQVAEANSAAPGAVSHAKQQVEVLVVDNDSPDRATLEDLTRTHPWMRLVVESGRGAATARNRGVAESRAPHLLFLDADCLPCPGWLAAALRLAGPDRVMGGRIDMFDETPPPRSGAEAFEAVFAFRQKMYVEKLGFSVTANLLTTRAVFAATGPMVPGLSEDLDWCRRAARAGFPVIHASALAVCHPTRSDWPALRRKWQRVAAQSFASHGTGRRARAVWAARAMAVAASGVLHLPKLWLSPALDGIGERWQGSLTLLRLRIVRSGWMLRQALTGRATP